MALRVKFGRNPFGNRHRCARCREEFVGGGFWLRLELRMAGQCQGAAYREREALQAEQQAEQQDDGFQQIECRQAASLARLLALRPGDQHVVVADVNNDGDQRQQQY